MTSKEDDPEIQKSLINVSTIRHEDDDGRKSTKVIYVENHLYPDGKVKKVVWVDEDPDYTYFMSKDPNQFEKPRNFVETMYVKPVTIRYDDLIRDVADKTGQRAYFQQCISNGRWRDVKNVLRHKDVHLADLDISDYKIDRWLIDNKQSAIPLRKSWKNLVRTTALTSRLLFLRTEYLSSM